MLVLSRQRHESIIITIPAGTVFEADMQFEVCVVDIRSDKVRLGFTAPPVVIIHREEIWREIENERIAKQQTSNEREGEHE